MGPALAPGTLREFPQPDPEGSSRARAAPVRSSSPFGLLLRNASASARGHPVDPEKNQRTNDCEQKALNREASKRKSHQRAAEEATDKRADNSDDHRDDDSTGVVARHNCLGDRAGDQADDDPCKKAHVSSVG